MVSDVIRTSRAHGESNCFCANDKSSKYKLSGSVISDDSDVYSQFSNVNNGCCNKRLQSNFKESFNSLADDDCSQFFQGALSTRFGIDSSAALLNVIKILLEEKKDLSWQLQKCKEDHHKEIAQIRQNAS